MKEARIHPPLSTDVDHPTGVVTTRSLFGLGAALVALIFAASLGGTWIGGAAKHITAPGTASAAVAPTPAPLHDATWPEDRGLADSAWSWPLGNSVCIVYPHERMQRASDLASGLYQRGETKRVYLVEASTDPTALLPVVNRMAEDRCPLVLTLAGPTVSGSLRTALDQRFPPPNLMRILLGPAELANAEFGAVLRGSAPSRGAYALSPDGRGWAWSGVAWLPIDGMCSLPGRGDATPCPPPAGIQAAPATG